jgi:hypothetical protein
MTGKFIVAKVCTQGKNKQKIVTIPKDVEWIEGDYLRIEKVE